MAMEAFMHFVNLKLNSSDYKYISVTILKSVKTQSKFNCLK